MRSLSEVSVILITHNAEEHLPRCLECLLPEVQSIEGEVVLVDNASDDQTRAIADRNLPTSSCLFQDKNLGFSKAVNLGIEKTSGEFVLVMNPDIFLEKGSLKTMTDFLRHEPQVAAVGPKHHYPNGNLQLTWGWRPTLLREWVRKKCQYGLRMGNQNLTHRMEETSRKPIKVDWLAGSCLLFRRSVNDKIGGWDEDFFLFFEDIDWGIRAREAGFEIVLVPGAGVRHVEGGSARKKPEMTQKIYRESQRLFAAKHWGPLSRTILSLYLAGR